MANSKSGVETKWISHQDHISKRWAWLWAVQKKKVHVVFCYTDTISYFLVP